MPFDFSVLPNFTYYIIIDSVFLNTYLYNHFVYSFVNIGSFPFFCFKVTSLLFNLFSIINFKDQILTPQQSLNQRYVVSIQRRGEPKLPLPSILLAFKNFRSLRSGGMLLKSK